MTYELMMMNHDAMFGCKKLSGSFENRNFQLKQTLLAYTGDWGGFSI